MKHNIEIRAKTINVHELHDGSAWVWVCPFRKRTYRKRTAQQALAQIQKNNGLDNPGIAAALVTWHCMTEDGERVVRVLAECGNAI